MRYLQLSLGFIIIFLMAYTSQTATTKKIDKQELLKILLKKRTSVISCTPDWTTYHLSKSEILQMMPLPGTGSHVWKISTKNDSAQFYFNQGINLYYGFHIIEAMPSFKKAETFDTGCAMLYWAEALAYGPNINDLGYAASPDALLAIKKSHALISKASAKERALIDAMLVRYSDDSTQSRDYLNQQYADKMKHAYTMFSADAEIGSLYADALMIQHPWNLWQHNGLPRSWTPEIQKVLEHVLKISPDHPGANHYYIHTMEASPYAYKATASADRLGNLAPGLSHMVHMPSHIYIRTGEYEKGSKVNTSAIEDYNAYLKLYPDVVNNAALYQIHNLHMKAACSINSNNYATALNDAIKCRESFDTSFLSMDAPIGDFMQYVYMTPELAMVTFKKWNDILKQHDVETRFHYASVLQLFAKGMAFANTGNLLMAKAALNKLAVLINQKDMAVILTPFNAPITSATIARYILMGAIAEKENNINSAISYFKQAVVTEDSLVYNEPRDWLIPARHYWGNALITAKRYNEAKRIFLEDLKVQPKNYIASQGLQAATHH